MFLRDKFHAYVRRRFRDWIAEEHRAVDTLANAKADALAEHLNVRLVAKSPMTGIDHVEYDVVEREVEDVE